MYECFTRLIKFAILLKWLIFWVFFTLKKGHICENCEILPNKFSQNELCYTAGKWTSHVKHSFPKAQTICVKCNILN